MRIAYPVIPTIYSGLIGTMRNNTTTYRNTHDGAFGSPIGSPYLPGMHIHTEYQVMLDKWCTQLSVVGILWWSPYQHIGSQGVLPIAKYVRIRGYTPYVVSLHLPYPLGIEWGISHTVWVLYH